MLRFATVIAVLATALVAAPPLGAQDSVTSAEAGFIPKFARYVQWPAGARPGPGRPYQLCVIGRDPFGRLLDRAAARESIGGHRLVVRRRVAAEAAAGCHLAYVQGPDRLETSRLLLALRGRPILTITDGRAGPERGMIHFTVSGGRVRFVIDEADAASRGLAISSRLLALALGVRQRR
jgi:hypothetical protein